MKTLQAIEATAAPKPPFSNSFEGETWINRWCASCANEEFCPLLAHAFVGFTPVEWTPDEPGRLGHQYRCTEYEAFDGDGAEPDENGYRQGT